jgi:hypothetical protein
MSTASYISIDITTPFRLLLRPIQIPSGSVQLSQINVRATARAEVMLSQGRNRNPILTSQTSHDAAQGTC